jgi:hypothetical protein
MDERNAVSRMLAIFKIGRDTLHVVAFVGLCISRRNSMDKAKSINNGSSSPLQYSKQVSTHTARAKKTKSTR